MSQYLRRIRAEVAGKVFEWDATKPAQREGIRIRFDVKQQDLSTPNVATIIVTNLRDETAQPAFFERKPVKLYAGYPDNLGLIFSGQIRQARNLRENVTDKILHILATDEGIARNTAVVNVTLKAGHTFRDRVDACFRALGQFGVKTGYIAKLPEQKFPRAFALHGMAKDLLRDVCTATNSSWSIQNGVAQLLDNGRPKPGKVTVLNSQTGLIGLPVQTIQGIEGECLLNPRLTPGGLVHIDQTSIQRGAISPNRNAEGSNAMLQQVGIAADGIYKLFVVEHRGDARGPEFYTSFVGVKSGDPMPGALSARGIHNPDLASASSGTGTASSNTGAQAATSGTGPTVEVGPIQTNLDPPVAGNPGEL